MPNQFDVWFVKKNQVFRAVPFETIAEWVQESKVLPTDKVRKTGSDDWIDLENHATLSMYLSGPEPEEVQIAEGAEPEVGLDFSWKKSNDEEDDDVDMIPLIDISLVLLIFFMMTTTISAISRIQVPEMENANKIDSNPEIIRIDIDWTEKRAVYGIGFGNRAPDPENNDISDPAILLKKLDGILNVRTGTAKIRIAAHADLPYEKVDQLISELQKRIDEGVRISNYMVQVSDRR